MKRITVLGSTGSIGLSTLDVLARHPERFSVFALTAARQTDLLLEQCLRHAPQFAVMVDASSAADLQARLKTHNCPTRVLVGEAALCEVAAHPDCDYVMAAIVGAAGLPACMAAARAGKRIMLANKEALVVGGEVFLQAAREGGAQILPVDSEHSAIFQSLPADRALWADSVDKVILTASGGPFRGWREEDLEGVTPEQACAHPNWTMGRKISVDSATMMNKALEVIEAKYLFDLAPQQIEVLIHPQSVVHSMVQYKDGSVVAQLGVPDMRGPIAYALSWPERIASGAAPIDFSALGGLSFENPSAALFPGLDLAWQAMRMPRGATAVLNAANEVAVEAFLNRAIGFRQIHRINQFALEQAQTWLQGEVCNVEQLLEIDTRTRQWAKSHVYRNII